MKTNKMEFDKSFYGTVRWTTGDIQMLFELSDEEAHEWLHNNERLIQNRLVELGWEVLEDLGKMDDLPPLKEI
jgi:hypothetical protein